MFEIKLTIEDGTIGARRCNLSSDHEDYFDGWKGTSINTFNGEKQPFHLSDVDMAAVVYMAMLDDRRAQEDPENAPIVKRAYAAIQEWRNDCKPLP